MNGYRYNSTFKVKPSRLKKNGIKRSLRPTLKKAGKKARLREQINRPNRIRFAELGLLNVCEAKLPGCWPNGRLTWAHGKKDRLLTMHERKYLVIRACTVCHHQMDEQMSHEQMLEFVKNVIANRRVSCG